MDDQHDECTESYRDCMRTRQERVQRVIEANPKASARHVAKVAGVTPTAVNKYKKKMENGFSTKNAVEPKETQNLPQIRRADWKRREPQKREILKWFNQYLGWSKTAQGTARMWVFNQSHRLPEEAYYDDQSTDGNGTVGSRKRSFKGEPGTRLRNLSAS